MNSATIEITTNPPVADFSGSPTTGFAPMSVQFTDLSTNSPTSWLWDFGDGATSTEQNPLHEYTTPGVYSVSLTATNDFGSGSTSKTDYITVQELTQTLMYVNSITVTAQAAGGPNRVGEAQVTILDQNMAPVAGALVSGSFNAPDNTVFTATTDASGAAILQSNKTRTPPADWCFTVTDVSATGYVYDPSMNVVTTGCQSGAAAKTAVLPEGYRLDQNFPNPFNPSTEIAFAIPEPMHVKLSVYNVVGQHVMTLVDGELPAGDHQVSFDGSSVGSGIYLYRLEAGDVVSTKKMIMIK
jgi:PKD repeat protein